MDGVRHDRGGFAQSVCLDGLAVACGAKRTQGPSAPAVGAGATSPAPGQEQGAPRRPGPLGAEADRPAGRQSAVPVEGATCARVDGDPAGMPAFLAAFAELRAALGPCIAAAARSCAEPRVGAPCRSPVSGRPALHTTSQEVTAPAPGARAATRTASPGNPSTR